MLALLSFAALFAVGQAATYLVLERGHRNAWAHEVRFVPPPRTEAPFRGTGVEAPYWGVCPNARAPWGIRAVALWSIGMGQMFVPGLAAACFGLMFWGVGLLGIPGCVLAMKIWRLGPRLLRAELGAVAEAVRVARFAELLNVLVLVSAAAMILSAEMVALGVFTAGYALLSLTHALALRWVSMALAQKLTQTSSH